MAAGTHFMVPTIRGHVLAPTVEMSAHPEDVTVPRFEMAALIVAALVVGRFSRVICMISRTSAIWSVRYIPSHGLKGPPRTVTGFLTLAIELGQVLRLANGNRRSVCSHDHDKADHIVNHLSVVTTGHLLVGVNQWQVSLENRIGLGGYADARTTDTEKMGGLENLAVFPRTELDGEFASSLLGDQAPNSLVPARARKNTVYRTEFEPKWVVREFDVAREVRPKALILKLQQLRLAQDGVVHFPPACFRLPKFR